MGLFSRDPDADSGADDAGGEDTSFWEERGFVASAIVVGAIVVCLLVWFFARGDGTPVSQPTQTPSTVAPTEQPTGEPTVPPATPTEEPTGTPTRRPTPGAGAGCRAKNPDQRIPHTAPIAVTWEFETDMLIPTQQVGGPAAMDSAGIRYCFAHSPTGAVLAAMVILGQIRNPELTERVLMQQVVANPGRTRALAEARGPRTPETAPPGQSQFTGFKVLDYLPNRAIIAVAVRIDDRNVAAMPVTMVWQRGDWRAELKEDGSFNGETAPDLLRTLDGYVRFGGA
ncbi:hypothetical protein GCM10009789_18160 [Kribbella sancticallisti]|uniref:DUF8175 domain-containing protein n=1 Tax=Kribbella sancticallisti TaxID=460087 RepID=A0ABN2CW19_9ACTN